jgi:uncharacterized membrane protein YjjP (DUF1212 family)
MEKNDSYRITESKELGSLLLDIGASLLHAGASCSLTKNTISKFAEIYNFEAHMMIASKSVSLALNDKQGHAYFDGIRTTYARGIDFTFLSAIYRLSRLAKEKKLTIPELRNELNIYKATGHYHRFILLCFVSLSGASLCYTFGGSIMEMLITYGATFCGLFTKQQLIRYKFNSYLCTFMGAIVASTFTAAFHVTGVILLPVNAFSSCVLFLIPGVLFINSFTDIIDGNTLNGIDTGVIALIHALAIALGLSATMFIFNLG